MKKLLLILLFPVLAFAQNYNNSYAVLDSAGGTVSLYGHSFAGTDNDTIITEPVYIVNYKTVYLNLMSLDSASILIDYAVSDDGTNYNAYAAKDSLSHSTAGANGFKSVDFTSTTLGAAYVRFRFRTSALAFPLGTTTPTFTPTVVLKRY